MYNKPSLPVPDITILDYPLFDITPEERQILLEAISGILSLRQMNRWQGLCSYLPNSFEGFALRKKVTKSIEGYLFLHHLLKDNNIVLDNYLTSLDWEDYAEIQHQFRLIWINKLLDQDSTIKEQSC